MDIRLFQVFLAIYRLKSVSKAATDMGLSQPSISLMLRRLRTLFDDPLFVRTPAGMEPTPRANALIARLQGVVEATEELVHRPEAFDPARSSRRFTICIGDSSLVLLLSRVIEHLRLHAPSITLEVVSTTAESPEALASGRIDLAIGFIPNLGAGFYQQKLFDDEYVCVVSTRHPRIGQRITARQFATESHVRVTSTAPGQVLLDKALARNGYSLKIAVSMPSFIGVGQLVTNSELIATVPRLLGRTLTASTPDDIRLVRAPFALPHYPVRQHWHRRYHHDQQVRWLRQMIAKLFSR